MRLSLTLMALAMAALPLGAAEPDASPPLPVATTDDIPPEEWRSMVAGQTLHYRINGENWALERYAPSGDGVVLQMLQTGECLTGHWSYAQGQYCFAWNTGETSCFRHLRADGQILVIHMEDGAPTGGVQTMDLVGDVPMTCGGQFTS